MARGIVAGEGGGRKAKTEGTEGRQGRGGPAPARQNGEGGETGAKVGMARKFR